MNDLSGIKKTLKSHQRQLEERFKVKEMALFGSYARNEYTEESDLDILVDFKEPVGFEFIELAEFLEKILELKIDLVSRGGAMKSSRWKYIEKDLDYV